MFMRGELLSERVRVDQINYAQLIVKNNLKNTRVYAYLNLTFYSLCSEF